MNEPPENPLKRVIGEIHRRSLWQVLGVYVVSGWIVYEVVQSLTEGLGVPPWFPPFAFVLLLVGLPGVRATVFAQEGARPVSRSSKLRPLHAGASVLATASILANGTVTAQNAEASADGAVCAPAVGPGAAPSLDGPVVLPTARGERIRVVPIAGGLSHPWGLAFRQDGDILVTERDRGTLRVVREGRLDPRPIPGVPEVYSEPRFLGLMDVAVHPDDDRLVYLTYSKPRTRDGEQGATVALARGRLRDGALTAVRDIFVAEAWSDFAAASRLLFGPDGKLYMTVGGAFQLRSTADRAQDPGTHAGKLLRLNDDGTAPRDNPFVGRPGHLPEIFSMGHRNQLGLAFHPDTGRLWATENGPQGGDEANIIRPGANYGWPLASYSRRYSGAWVTGTPWRPEFEAPEIVWWPSVAPSGAVFYAGERFPAWKGDLFVGALMVGRTPGTGHLERVVFNPDGQEIQREWLLSELKQRIRDVQQGPDGHLYVLTEEERAFLLRIEPGADDGAID